MPPHQPGAPPSNRPSRAQLLRDFLREAGATQALASSRARLALPGAFLEATSSAPFSAPGLPGSSPGNRLHLLPPAGSHVPEPGQRWGPLPAVETTAFPLQVWSTARPTMRSWAVLMGISTGGGHLSTPRPWHWANMAETLSGLVQGKHTHKSLGMASSVQDGLTGGHMVSFIPFKREVKA